MKKGLSILFVMLFCIAFVLASSAEVFIYTGSSESAEDVVADLSWYSWGIPVVALIIVLVAIFVFLHSRKKKVVKSKTKKRSVKKKVSKKKVKKK